MIGYIDYKTKHVIIFAMFYLIPISTAVIFSGRLTGLVLSLCAAILLTLIDIRYDSDYTNIIFFVINNLMQFCYFVIHTYLRSVIVNLYIQADELSLIDSLTDILIQGHSTFI